MFGLLLGFSGGAGSALLARDRGAQGTPSPDLSTPSVAPTMPKPSPTATPTKKPSPARPPLFAGPDEPSAACGTGGRVIRFRVLVEKGLDTTPARYAQDLLSVLCDERSWIRSGEVRFRYDPKGSLLVGLRSPAQAEKRCMQLIGLSVNFYYSCAGYREVVLNADRWFKGSDYWPGGVTLYRQMLVNHEIGHILGQRHRRCSTDGAPAPVMMQQSKGLTTNGHTCRPNPWPRPYELASL